MALYSMCLAGPAGKWVLGSSLSQVIERRSCGQCRRRELVARQVAEEAAQREAEQREAEAAARRAREELQRELRKLQQSFALRLEGNAMLSPPQKVMPQAYTDTCPWQIRQPVFGLHSLPTLILTLTCCP